MTQTTNEKSTMAPKDTDTAKGLSGVMPFIMSSPNDLADSDACCGAPAGPPSSPYEKPGYSILSFVDGFVLTKSAAIPRVKTRLNLSDRLGTLKARLNLTRNNYTIAPGLYAIGDPDKKSPTLVTANFKLTFDQVRCSLDGTSAWLLVLDTRGINVWCAAGKGTFATDELVNRIRHTGLKDVLDHNKVIIPQLGATGVSAIQVKKQTGFSVIWGPVHCRDLKEFMHRDMRCSESMRQVTFTMKERIVLIPVEISIALKPAALLGLAALILSGIGPHVFSISQAINRGIPALIVLLGGMLAGAAITPMLLDRLPGRMFSVKGAVAGLITALPLALLCARFTGFTGILALVFAATSISSYLAMNFTGSTPFTSPSGVEKEMKLSIPVQAATLLTAIIGWIVSAF